MQRGGGDRAERVAKSSANGCLLSGRSSKRANLFTFNRAELLSRFREMGLPVKAFAALLHKRLSCVAARVCVCVCVVVQAEERGWQ